MKTPQRTFVVEFKSGRRQSKSRTSSIWGDTNLKALAREVADNASHLFNQIEPDVVPKENEALVPAAVDACSVSERAGNLERAELKVTTADSGAVEGQVESNTDHPVGEVVAQTQAAEPFPQVDKAPGRARKSRSTRPVTHTPLPEQKSADKKASLHSKSASVPTIVDEIAALDAENKKLKKLLAEHLHAQNLELKRMLGRFQGV
ncbi:hypothetical protein [Ensifer sp. YR511]|uniref:hypothetical protein n=1 Tax=Ensifer sp. YR511 TaxID=1855294 RepID=UPI0008864856|nr:hypothetical protein [Ensifer sp. YR511]SDN05357.1 hypothetical protein SAMN05216328_117110 [Ensifer sp. YR511]